MLRRRHPDVPLCEIHTAISPDLGFATRVHYLAATLRRNGGALASCPLIVTVAGDEYVDMARVYPWSEPLGIEWRYVDDETYARRGISSNMNRFSYDFASPTVLIIDADTVFCAPIDDAVERVLRRPSLTGVIAHVSPFIGVRGEQAIWGEIFEAAGLGRPPMLCEHPGWGILDTDPARRLCPPYYNLGFVLAPREFMSAVGASLPHEMDIVDTVLPTVFRAQLALTMAVVRAGVPWGAVPMRFNLPNIRAYIPRYQGELDDARVIHYLREEEVTRAENFASPQAVGEWIARDHGHPINARLAQTLREVHDEVLACS